MFRNCLKDNSVSKKLYGHRLKGSLCRAKFSIIKFFYIKVVAKVLSRASTSQSHVVRTHFDTNTTLTKEIKQGS